MFICAVIHLQNGEIKQIEAKGKLALPKFFAKLAPHAKKENKLVKIVCDDFRILAKLRKELSDVPVFYGFRNEEGELCVLE